MRRAVVSLVLVLLAPAALSGQATADQARLMFTVGLGQTGAGGTLWHVGHQPFAAGPSRVDTIAVTRDFRRSLDVYFSGTYFPNDNLGFNVEAQLLGLATEDNCQVISPAESTTTRSLCRSLSRSERSASAVSLSGGVMFRLWSNQPLHPFVRANAGFVVSQQSFIKTMGTVTGDSGVVADLILYPDEDPASLQPYLSFGGGIAAVVGRGFQFRAELRDNWVRLPVVSAPSPRQGIKPETDMVGRHFLTFTVGLDIVLERKRGRRY